MSCCGKNRRRPPTIAALSTPMVTAPRSAPRTVRFEYTGATALTVVGPVSGRRYRFAAPGSVVDVDARDAPSLMAVPQVRPARATADQA
jgi:hypothetical protein